MRHLRKFNENRGEIIPNLITFPEGSDIYAGTNIKFGIDPTAPRLHLGHMVPLRVVGKLQEAGKNVTIVLGTFTAQMGDPSGKDKTRPILSSTDTEANANKILEQVNKILKPGFNLFRNGDLFNTMTVPELMKIISKFTTTQLLSRDAFQKRMEQDKSIGMHELIVPVCQGYDSVHLDADVEIGGTDQLFNFQVARKLQELEGQTAQVCAMMPIINGTDGQKMSKSLNNCIYLDESPEDMFGKCMSTSDATMEQWIPLLTDIENDPNDPMGTKKRMAHDVVKQLHSQEAADRALEGFQRRIQGSELPDDMKEIEAKWIVGAVAELRESSNSLARQLLRSGAVQVDRGDGFTKVSIDFELEAGDILKAGKRFFAKIV